MPGNSRYLLFVGDAVLAAASALLGLPVASVLWTPRDSLVGLLRMPAGEWAVMLIVLIMPAALLGVFAGFTVRCCGGRRSPAVAAAGAALGTSVLGHSAFYWWLSNVL